MNRWKQCIKYRRIINKSYLLAGLLLFFVFITSYHLYLDVLSIKENVDSYLGWMFSFKGFSWIQTIAFSLLDFIRFDFNVIQLYAIVSTTLLIIALTLLFSAFYHRNYQVRHNMIMKKNEPVIYIERLQHMAIKLHNQEAEKKLRNLYQMFSNDIEFGIHCAKVCCKENEIAEKLKEIESILNQCFDIEEFDISIEVIKQLMDERKRMIER